MKRTVTIDKVSIRGVGLMVEFDGHPPAGRLGIKAPYFGFTHGCTEDENGSFCTIWSPAFKNTNDAKVWLFEVTAEVSELARICNETIAQFKELESVEEV